MITQYHEDVKGIQRTVPLLLCLCSDWCHVQWALLEDIDCITSLLVSQMILFYGGWSENFATSFSWSFVHFGGVGNLRQNLVMNSTDKGAVKGLTCLNLCRSGIIQCHCKC